MSDVTPKRAPKIGYDAQALLSGTGGAGKGAQLRTLIGPFFDRFVGFASAEPNHSGWPLVQEGLKGHTLWQQFSLPRSLHRHGIDAFLAPANVAPFRMPRKTALILVLHDTILLDGFRRSDRKGRLFDSYRAWQISGSVRQARTVLTVSEHARGEILRRFGHPDVRVIPCTVPEAWFAPRPLEGREGYVLMVTSDAPHKNAMGAFEGYARYVRETGEPARRLDVVGLWSKRAAYMQRLQELGIATRVRLLPFLSDEELRATYQGAAALLFPSLAEGFGIPMLEAMATGTPVIAADAASLPEVGGDAACYFNPHKAEGIARALRSVLGNPVLQQQMAQRGLARAQVYAPARVREAVVAFWEEVAGGSLLEEPAAVSVAPPAQASVPT